MYHYLTRTHKFAGYIITILVVFSMLLTPLLHSVAYADETEGSAPETTQTEEVEAPQEDNTGPEEVLPEGQPSEEETVGEEETSSEGTSVNEDAGEPDPGDGASGEEGGEVGGDPSLIVTGDAVAGLGQETNTNFNDTGVSGTISEEDGGTGSTTVDSPALPETEHENSSTTEGLSGTGLPGDVSATTTNDAALGTDASVGAGTGDNTAGGADSLIVTGDAIAFANVVNLVNTNIFNSDGLIAFFNEVLGINSLDLRETFTMFDDLTNAVSTPSCNLSACTDGTTLNVNNTNGVTITNDVVVNASTGGNAANGDGGMILTGDAYAAANVFNLANTNITDSNYLLLSFNNFGDYAGDIILPPGDVLGTLFGAGGTNYTDATVINNNNATITNSMSVGADTGGNEADGGMIVTGDARADGAIQNIVNTNLFGGSDLLIVLRIHGDWNGEVVGLPEGLAWAETENGIMLYSTGSGNPNASTVGDVNVTNTNNATINNNVSVYALTGDNKVNGGGGAIATGNAYAAANITNVANTNILGQNWALLVFDIFGNWNGNLTFGQPDLWIGANATPESSPVMPGTPVTYTFTVTNRGDARASNVILDQYFSEGELVYDSTIDDIRHGSPRSRGSWNIGDIGPGQTKIVSYTTHVNDALPNAVLPITVDAEVTADENDANDDNNHESITLFSGSRGGVDDIRGSRKTFESKVEVVKTASSDHIMPGDSVDYTISITNHGGPLYHAVLRDVLSEVDGEMTSEQYWELGTILTDETVSVSYTMNFGDDVEPGTYTNTADVGGVHVERSWKNGLQYISPSDTHTITIGDGEPQVLGISTDTCEPYLKTFLKRGVHNDESEVIKLQEFLNNHMQAGLAVTGIFDLNTERSVRDFQDLYSADILSPWGMGYNSGYVYLTTRKKINEIECNYATEFPLSSLQELEIEKFRTKLEGLHNTTTEPLPLFGEADDIPPNEEVTLDTSTEGIKNEDIVTVSEDLTLVTTTSPVAQGTIYPFLAEILRALTWFRNLAQV